MNYLSCASSHLVVVQPDDKVSNVLTCVIKNVEEIFSLKWASKTTLFANILPKIQTLTIEQFPVY